MILRDWREADPATVRECYERERRHWLDRLSWDTTWTWATVEEARFGQGLPGFLAVDGAGRVGGWTFYVVDDGRAHIGGFVADSDAATRVLLDGVLHGSEESGADATACFVLDRAPGLAAALADHGFAVEPFHYLSLPLGGGGVRLRPDDRNHAPLAADAWRDGDLDAVAALLEASYTRDAGRHFAPGGNWEKYAIGLVDQAGCGVFDTKVTRMARDDEGLLGAVLVTAVSPATAHIAQLAVHPGHRGRGLASQLTREAALRAAEAGKSELTLLVGDRNQKARRLYTSMGFTQKATFLAAWRDSHRAALSVAAS
jgi:ribosomal protein S18 acetylase RimI-like enzyme